MTENKIQDQPAFGKWQPIKTAPRDETEILLADPSGSFEVGYWYADGWVSWEGLPDAEPDWIYWEPTHWMPLPEPPETGE